MTKNNDQQPRFTKSQWQLFFAVLILGGLGLYFFVLKENGLNDSAALYVGLPVLLALAMSLTPKSKSVTGTTMKVLTIALLLSAPVLQEGFICIIMATPIFYGIAALIAKPIDKHRKKKAEGDNSANLQVAAISVFMAVAALEGTHESLTFDRYNQVEHSRIVHADIESVREYLAKTPTFDKPRPIFTRLYPLPKSVEGSGLEVGDQRKLHFVYNKWLYFNAHKGDTIFRITESNDNYIRFDVPHDDSYLSNYLSWQSSEVFLEKAGENATKVTWRLSYKRKIDPIWYFGPLQYYTANLTAETLIDNVADPTI